MIAFIDKQRALHNHHRTISMGMGVLGLCAVVMLMLSGCRTQFAFVEGYEIESQRWDGALEIIVVDPKEVPQGSTVRFWARCKLEPPYSITWDFGSQNNLASSHQACGRFPYAGLYVIQATCRNKKNHYAQDSVVIEVKYMNQSTSVQSVCPNVIMPQ